VSRLPYALLCALLGAALGWLPMLVHGPIPEKYNIRYIRGEVAVWGWYSARLLIGFLIGSAVGGLASVITGRQHG